jgi:hypothetical protein
VVVIGIGYRQVLVQQPEDALGEYIAEFLVPGSGRGDEGVVRKLIHPAGHGGWLQPLIAIEQEEPVVVIDVGEERVAAVQVHGERATADE